MFYLGAIGAILVATVAALRLGARDLSAVRRYADLFFMGGAFLLLETSGIVRFALWFGTTWVVNAMVLTSTLASVLLAIEVVDRFRLPSLTTLYALLATTLIVNWVTPATLCSSCLQCRGWERPQHSCSRRCFSPT